MISKSALMFVLCVCACSSPTSRTPNASQKNVSTQRAPELVLKTGDGTLISRRLLSLPTPVPSDVQAEIAQATPGQEIIELPFQNTDAPGRIVLYRAAAPAHGIVFFRNDSDPASELVKQLLASRGYHVIVSDRLEIYVVTAELAAWVTTTLGQLPIACVDVHRCEPHVARAGAPPIAPTRAAAIVDDEIWPADSCHAGCAGPVPELVLVSRYPRGKLTLHDESRARCTEKRERARAAVTGVTFRGKRDLEPIGEFAVIETFLAQHLGGRAEPLDPTELRRAGLRVTYGLDQVPAIAALQDLALLPLDPAARAKVESGFAELLGFVRGAVTRGCPGLVERLKKLTVPDTLVRYCQSDEHQLLAGRFHDDAMDAARDAGCDEPDEAAAQASETLQSHCER